ncbi:uncharacterized protein LOC120358701 [Solenopsis invicta]|uniref:uncharacterized protein LOC120358701 n=1 Tax=Solenopsis invicta TaxID=13686 RepID=UPI00193CBB0E|nr:uncharacterized protein LOC120358701 [Solenopsis invicta]
MEVTLEYPLPIEWENKPRCPRCWEARLAGAAIPCTGGAFSDAAHLAKHLKAKHPGDYITYKCSLCNFKGGSRYPLKDVKAHYAKVHSANNSSSSRVGASRPGTRGNSDVGEQSDSGARSRVTGATARPRGSNPPAQDPRQPRLSFRSTPPPGPSGATRRSATPPTAAAGSPSYATVTAGELPSRPPAPVEARRHSAAQAMPHTTTTAAAASTSAAAAAAAATSAGPPTTATGKPRVLSVQLVRLPIKIKAARPATTRAKPTPLIRPAPTGATRASVSAANSQSVATRSARAPSHPPQRTSPVAGASASSSTTTRWSGEGAQRSPLDRRTPPARNAGGQSVATRTRRATSVPTEKSDSAARLECVPPHPRTRGAATSIGKAGGTKEKPPDSTPPTNVQGGVATRTRSRASSTPVEKSALEARLAALDRPPPGAKGSAASRSASDTAQQGTSRESPARSPSLPQTTRGSPTGGRSNIHPATSLPATLTTCTVTTTTCGGPVMSTGLPVGKGRSPPRPSLLPTILEASPCVAAVPTTPGEQRTSPQTAPSSPGVGVRRRRGAAIILSSDSEGDEGEPWRTHRGRRAGRRHTPPGLPPNSRSPPVAHARPTPETAKTASANSRANASPRGSFSDTNNNSFEDTVHSSQSVRPPPSTEAASRRGTSLEDRVGGDTGNGAARVSAEHPCAPVCARGVMGRRAQPLPIVPPREEGGAPPNLVGRHGGRERHHGRRRVDAPVAQPSRGYPVPVAVVRQRRRELVADRDALVERAANVATIADLEAYAASVAAWFGEDATEGAGGAAPGVQGRPNRRRNAGARRGARGGVPPGGEGDSRAGQASLGPATSQEEHGGWVREAKRLQALYRTNRRKAVREILQGPADLCQVPRQQVQEYFERLYRGGEDLAGGGVQAEPTDPSDVAGEFEYLADPEMILECRGPRGATVKIPPGARAQVVGRLRSAVAEYYASTLLAKRDQGKVFEVSSRCRVSNHFIRGGSFTRFADWRFIHKARLDVLPLNGARRWGDGDKRCRRCGEVSETLPHVLCHCGVHSAAIQLRHNAVLHRLWKACRMPGEKRVNQRIEGIDGELGELRPDLVIRHEPSKSVVICDVTVPFENRWEAFEDARARKIAKYSPLAEELQRRGYRVVVTAFVVGALGSWDPRNEAVLRLLRIGTPYASLMRRLMVSDTIRWSRDIYVEHVSGTRQYRAPPRPAGGGFATPPRAIRRRWLADEGTQNIKLIFGAGWVSGACSDPAAGRLGIAVPSSSAHRECECPVRAEDQPEGWRRPYRGPTPDLAHRYPLKDVKAHYAKVHSANNSSSSRVGASRPGTRGNSDVGEQSDSGARSRVTGATARPRGSNPPAQDPRQPRLSFRSTPPPGPSGATRRSATPPTAAAGSPSYATVTAGELPSRPPAPVEARPAAAAAATSAGPPTTATGKPRVLSVQLVRLPIKIKAARPATTRAKPTPLIRPAPTGATRASVSAANSQSVATRSARAPSHPPQRTSPVAGASASSSTTTRWSGEGAQRSPLDRRTPPARNAGGQSVATRTRRATSVPTEKSDSAARLECVPPHPRTRGAATSIGKAGGTKEKPPDSTPPTNVQGGVATRTRSRASSTPVEKSALEARLAALDRPPPGAKGSAASRSASDTAQQGTSRESPARSPSLPQTTRGSPTGGRSNIHPATSLPATLTTCTVTTTTCGGPVMSTGLPVGKGRSPPRPSLLPTILEASPCVAAVPTTPGEQRTSPQTAPSSPGPIRPTTTIDGGGKSSRDIAGGPCRRRHAGMVLRG